MMSVSHDEKWLRTSGHNVDNIRDFVDFVPDSLGQLTSIDLVSAKGKTKVNWLILFHSFIRRTVLISDRRSERVSNKNC